MKHAVMVKGLRSCGLTDSAAAASHLADSILQELDLKKKKLCFVPTSSPSSLTDEGTCNF